MNFFVRWGSFAALLAALSAGAQPQDRADYTVGTPWTGAAGIRERTSDLNARVTDDGVSPLSAARTFTVIVASRPVITSVTVSNDLPTVTWSTISGQSYRLQFTPLLESPAWLDLPGDVTAAGSTASKTDAEPAVTNRFYRVQVLR